MTTTITTPANGAQATPPLTIKGLLNQDNVKKKFAEIMGKNASAFITSILQCVASSNLLQDAEPYSIYHAASVAATLNLPINNSLGQAYIVPYKDRRKNIVLAQFQIGWKGLVQLGLRTNQYLTIHTTEVYENQFESYDYMTGEFKMKNVAPVKGQRIVGYVSYFQLLSGFKKSYFMTHEQMEEHAQEYSQAYRNKVGTWSDGEKGFIAMGKKTVLKLNLDKFGPKSIELITAIRADQAVIKDEDATDVDYVDNPSDKPEPIDKAEERVTLMIGDATTLEDLDNLRKSITTEAQADLLASKREELLKGKGKESTNLPEDLGRGKKLQ